MSTLSVPDVDGMDTLTAALEYAKAGWYVIPVAKDTKAPTVVGKGWHKQSSRDPEQLVAWFAGADHALGLHVGRSGAIVFDVDEPSKMPSFLWDAIFDTEPPHQSTRVDVPNRGHYVFLQPPGRTLGNGRGKIVHPEHGTAWGEVRGMNGIIVAEPSLHVKETGRYKWVSDGEVPVLPDEIASLLPDAAPSADAAHDGTVTQFLEEHAQGSNPSLADPIIKRFGAELKTSSRHEALTSAMAWAMRDAHAGLINAGEVVEELRTRFMEAMKGERTPGRFPKSEFAGVLAWAVGQALATDPEERRTKVMERLPESTGSATDYFEPRQPSSDLPSVRDSSEYFPYNSRTRRYDLDGVMLADDVLSLGPLAIGNDHRFWSYAHGVWSEDEYVVRNRCTALLKGAYRPSHTTIADHHLRGNPAVIRLEGEAVRDYINFLNGMLDWRTGNLLPHDEGYKSTVQIPVEWDPQARCPLFNSWLNSILSPDYTKLAWQMMGYLLMNGNPLQVAFLFLGRGRNGKGTLMRVLKYLLGQHNIAAVSLDDLNGNRFAAAALYGKLANLAGDIDATFQESTARFKSLTGEDIFRAENKGQPGFEFTSWAVPVFSANKIPGSSDTSEGYLRRWIVLKFDRMIGDDEKIPNLEERFLAELPGIAATAVENLRSLMVAKRFKSDGDIAEGKAEFVEAVDQVRQWIDQCVDRDTGSEERSMLYASYKVWADVNGQGRLKASEFYHRLENAGYEPTKINGQRRFRGLRVRELRMRGDIFAEGT